MFLFFFFFIIFHFDTLSHKSLHEFFIFFWKSAFTSLPPTTAGNIQTTVVDEGCPKNKALALKAQIFIGLFVNFVRAE